jgi:hypothetical protein
VARPDDRKPSETPYLHVRETEAALFPFAVEIVGNAKALLQLRKQIDRALEGIDTFPFDDTLYRELDGGVYEVLLRRARSREEMRPPAPRVEKAPERLPWAETARRQEEARKEQEGRGFGTCPR